MKKASQLTFSELFLIIRSYCLDIHQNSLYLALMEKYYGDSINNRQASNELKNFKRRGTLSGNIRTSIQIKDIEMLSNSYKEHFKKDFLRYQELKDLLLRIISKYNKQFDIRISPIPINNDTDLSTIIAFMLIIVVSETTDEHSSENKRIISDDFSIESFINTHDLYDDTDSTVKPNTITFDVLHELSKNQFKNFYTHKDLDLKDALFSNGLFIDSSSDKPLSDWILTGHLSTNGYSQPLTSYLSDGDKSLIVLGEGGIGKTTFLYNSLKAYHDDCKINSVPIYIKLSNCKLSEKINDVDIIINEISNLLDKHTNNKIISQKDIIDEFTKSPIDNHPQYLLLLDGYNEITSLDKGDTRISVSKEINKLVSYDNVRIILTSRNVSLLDLNESAFLKIQATGISEEKIKKYLNGILSTTDFSEVIQSVELMEILRIPLFLKMLSKSYKSDHYVPKSRGSILFNYYNNLINQYNEKNNVDAKNSITTSLVMHYILDFIMPCLSFKMCTEFSFEIKYDQFVSVISMCKNEAYMASKIKLPLFSRFYNGFHTLHQIASRVNEMDPYDIFLIIKEYFGIIYSDSTDRIYFSHQYIRDYFSAYYIIRNIYIASNDISDILDHSNCLDNVDIIDEEHLSLIKDIIMFSSFFNTDIVYSVLKKYKHTAYGNSNLINILSCINDYDLSEYDFNNLDLRKTNLNNINFYNIATKQHSTFNKCSLGPATFFNGLHSHRPTNVVQSSDKKYLITFVNNIELKEIIIWDFKTNKSIYSYNLIINNPIINIDYIDQLLLISVGDNIFRIKEVIVFDTISEEQGKFSPLPDKCFITSISYCPSVKRIYIIFDNKYLSIYDRGDTITFFDQLILPNEFVDRLNFNPYITYNNPILQNSTEIYLGVTSYKNYDIHSTINPDSIIKRIIPLNSKELLYIESDCYYPYVHTYDGKIISLENSNLEINDSSIHSSPDLNKILDSIFNYSRQYMNFFIFNIETKQLNPITFSGYGCTHSPYFLYRHQLNLPKYEGFFLNSERTKLLVSFDNQLFCCELNKFSSTKNNKQFDLIDNCIIKDIIVNNIEVDSALVKKDSKDNNDVSTITYNIIDYDSTELWIYSSDHLVYRKNNNETLIESNHRYEEVIFTTPDYSIFAITPELTLYSEKYYDDGFEVSIRYSKNKYDEYNTMTVYDSSFIIDIFSSKNTPMVYILYYNGTILFHDGSRMSASEKYNYTHGSYVKDSYFNDSKNELLLLYNETASLNSKGILKKINLETNVSTQIFTNRNCYDKVKAYPDQNILITYIGNEISIYTYDTLSFISSIDYSKFNICYEDVFYEPQNNVLIIPFYQDKSIKEIKNINDLNKSSECIIYKIYGETKVVYKGIYRIPVMTMSKLSNCILIKNLYGYTPKTIVKAIDSTMAPQVIFENTDSPKKNIIVSTEIELPVHISDESGHIIDNYSSIYMNNVYIDGYDLLLRQPDNSFIRLSKKHDEFADKYGFSVKYSYSQPNNQLYVFSGELSYHIYSIKDYNISHIASFTDTHPYKLTSRCKLHIPNEQTQNFD